MKASQQIKDFIGRMEGCKLEAYKPLSTDRWTIGYGTTYYTETDPVNQGDTIDQSYADSLLSNHIDILASSLSSKIIPDNITQNQFDAVISLIYNIGLSLFLSSPTGQDFYKGYNISAKFPLWDHSDGQTIQGLVIRRAKERQVYDNGNY